MKNLRLFIALPLDKKSLKAIAKYRDGMGRRTPWLSWTAVNNLHATVLFLGDIAASAVSLCGEAVRTVAASTPQFSLEFSRPMYAPPRGFTTMVWLGFKANSQFETLVKNLAASMKSLMNAMPNDFPGLARARQAETICHITLARFKKHALPSQIIRLGRLGLEGSELSVTKCLLMESCLTPAGPIYKTIGEYTFVRHCCLGIGINELDELSTGL